MNDGYYSIAIRRRPRWFWLLVPLWLFLELLLLQTAWASLKEEEPRASVISGIACLVLALAGVFVAFRARWSAPRQKQATTALPSDRN